MRTSLETATEFAPEPKGAAAATMANNRWEDSPSPPGTPPRQGFYSATARKLLGSFVFAGEGGAEVEVTHAEECPWSDAVEVGALGRFLRNGAAGASEAVVCPAPR